MSFVKGLKCRECGKHYPASPIYVCEFCFGPLEVVYDYEKIKKHLTRDVITSRPHNIWRYKELLPLKISSASSEVTGSSGLNTGYTPFFRARNLERYLKADEIYIKDDSVNHPTLSFKDRVVAVALRKAKEFGFKIVACASTGNLANAVASHSRQAGFECYVFIPADLEKSKVVSSLIYGAHIVAVNGNYDDVNRLCGEVASRYKNWGFVNVNLRPYYAEGSKTYGFEIVEQMGFRVPGNIVVPVASGSLLTKIYKGIKEFELLGLITYSKTKIYAAQAEGCSPVVKSIKENSDVIKPQIPHTIAKSLAIGNPADGYYARDIVKMTGGSGESVSDDEIVEGIKILAQTEGIFTETAGGVAVAVTKKLIRTGAINPHESIVICITGNGLKTQEAVVRKVSEPCAISPTIEAFESEFILKRSHAASSAAGTKGGKRCQQKPQK